MAVGARRSTLSCGPCTAGGPRPSPACPDGRVLVVDPRAAHPRGRMPHRFDRRPARARRPRRHRGHWCRRGATCWLTATVTGRPPPRDGAAVAETPRARRCGHPQPSSQPVVWAPSVGVEPRGGRRDGGVDGRGGGRRRVGTRGAFPPAERAQRRFGRALQGLLAWMVDDREWRSRRCGVCRRALVRVSSCASHIVLPNKKKTLTNKSGPRNYGLIG
ncbi:hypothetical protein BU14_0296s0011 [Porphyra umbilicalis]|uniref:Uncharacterized protein n=1 Tax=Porphyra umbilicalis TaxID=2786 RepID=A0A1X6P0J7_PORUM|nr:hypothetical protein BU14_0296s0011 [Porphyra umbilicalis]|eukprot:OSX74296.1 hypothetical protein BU14_0296s0011 [Porphyra umbilicalis]